jgi:hypothetical protein
VATFNLYLTEDMLPRHYRKITWLMLFIEMVTIFYENRTSFVLILFVCFLFSFFVRLEIVQRLNSKQKSLLHIRVK